MATKKTTKAKKTAQPRPFTVLCTVNNQQYEGSGNTLEEALLNLPVVVPFTRSVFIVAQGDTHSRPVSLTIPMYRRLFYPGLTGEIQRANFIKRHTILS